MYKGKFNNIIELYNYLESCYICKIKNEVKVGFHDTGNTYKTFELKIHNNIFTLASKDNEIKLDSLSNKIESAINEPYHFWFESDCAGCNKYSASIDLDHQNGIISNIKLEIESYNIYDYSMNIYYLSNRMVLLDNKLYKSISPILYLDYSSPNILNKIKTILTFS